MTELLQDRIEAARKELLRHDLRHLEPTYRHHIYCAFEPEPDSDPRNPQADWGDVRKRVFLGVRTTEHVLNVWDSNWPDDDLPRRLISAAVRELSEDVRSKRAETLLIESEQRIDDLAESEDDLVQRGMCVCLAARQTLYLAALNSDPFTSALEMHESDCIVTEGGIDSYCADVAHWAVAAYRGGLGTPNFSRDKNLEFWTWWLDQAIPRAWEQGRHSPARTNEGP